MPRHNKKKQHQAATLIQSFFKMTQIRRQFTTAHLEPRQLKSYALYALGNDPEFINIVDYQMSGKTALIGTSGLRTLKLACQLAPEDSHTKIFLLDYAVQAFMFWQALKQVMEKYDTEQDFLSGFLNFLSRYSVLIRHDEDRVYESDEEFFWQNMDGFFVELFEQYGFEKVRKTILHSTVIGNSWTDPIVFRKLKNICSYLEIENIVTYVSNIIDCERLFDQNRAHAVMENLAFLNPCLSLHTIDNRYIRLGVEPRDCKYIRDHSLENLENELSIKPPSYFSFCAIL